MEQDWLSNGCRLGWLIDPDEAKAYVFRADGSRETMESFDGEISGEEVLPGFVFQLKELKS